MSMQARHDVVHGRVPGPEERLRELELVVDRLVRRSRADSKRSISITSNTSNTSSSSSGSSEETTAEPQVEEEGGKRPSEHKGL